MPVSVSPSNISVLRASSHTGVAVPVFPDVCKTPTPGGPVPIPYPSMAGASQVKNVSRDASAKVVMTKDARHVMSTGDEAGSAGGVMSNKVKAQASQARIGQLRSRLQAITTQLGALRGGDPNPWHKLVDEYVLVTTELYLELTPK